MNIFDDFVEIVRFPKEVKSGYDHNFVIWPSNLGATLGQNKFAARSVHQKSGRTLDIYSNQPGIQFYTGKFINDNRNQGNRVPLLIKISCGTF